MGRCFIVDPVCAMTFGHSLNSLRYFSNLSSRFYSEVKILASKHLADTEETEGIEKYFNFYYFNIFDIPKSTKRLPNPETRTFDDNRLVATYDFSKMFIEHHITDDDAIFLPSADFYSIIGLIGALERFKGSRSPRILLRLIGVMENAVSTGPGRLNECLQKILIAISGGASIHISAETPKYASYLEDLLQRPIQTTPYPDFEAEILPPSVSDRLTILCGGSGRPDKGFYRLLNIIEICNKDDAPVNFIIQNIPDKDQMQNLTYINKLYAMPNVELLPGSIPYLDVIESYRKCHITMMPYDRSTYEYRGSAMLMESILFGRQSLGQSGTGFANQIEDYGAGECANTDSEFAAKVSKFHEQGHRSIYEKAKVARSNYISDVTEKYKTWMEY